MNKAVIGLLSLSLLISGGAAWELTGSIETNFLGSWATSQTQWGCNPMTSYFLDECVEPIDIEIGGATTSEVEWSIANTAATATDNAEQTTGSTKKRLNASYGVAMAGAKAASIMDLNDGYSESEALQNSSDIVRDWYGEIQKNVINYRNRHFLKLNNSINEIEQTSALSLSDVFSLEQAMDRRETVLGPVDDMKVLVKNKTLISGETTEKYVPQAFIKTQKSTCGGGLNSAHGWVNLTSSYTVTIEDTSCEYNNDYTIDDPVLKLENPDGNITEFYRYSTYETALTDVVETKDRAISNTQKVTSDIFGTYEPGEITVQGSLGPWEIMKVASTSYDSTGYYDFATLTAHQMGLNTNDTYAFKLQWSQEGSSETYQDVGQLFLEDGAFNDTIKAGVQYNVTDEVVWFTRTRSNGEIVQEDLNGTFTPLELTDKETGETVNKTGTQDIEVYESNITDLKNQLDELQSQYEQYQNEETGGGGGSGTGLFGMTPLQTGLTALVIFLILGMLAFIAGGVTT